MENKKNEIHDDFMDRRDMLKRMLKYSSIAAVVLAGPMTLLESGCGGGGGTTPDPPGPLPGSTAETAIAITRGSTFSNVHLVPGSSNICYYIFDQGGSTTMDLIVNITSLIPATGGMALRLLSASLTEIGSEWITEVGFPDTYGTDIASGNYLVFECGAAEVTFSFTLIDSDLPAWSNWNDYSDWSDVYSDWSDAYSDWSDAYSDWSDAYSDWADHWYDWYNAPWGNWMQSW